MELKRLYVGNLPSGSTESDLTTLFSDYGQVKKVELKTKENLVDPNNPKVLAFVTLSAEEYYINQCIDEISRNRFNGQYLSVSVAKESFLERLARERAEQAKVVEQPKAYDEAYSRPIQIPVPKSLDTSYSNKTIKFADDEDNQENNLLYESIARKNARNSMQNGKIKIESISSDPIHIINHKQKAIRRLDEKSQQADQKRKQSLKKMKSQYDEQKLAIQKALSTVDNKTKKVIFDDETLDSSNKKKHKTPNKMQLFDYDEDDVDEYSNDFKIKEQFEGKSGAKLMNLSTKFNLDTRFKLNKNFAEDGEDNEYNQIETENIQSEQSDERKWQMDLIDQVVGKNQSTEIKLPKEKHEKTMLRFDPSKQDHQKYIITQSETKETEARKRKLKNDVVEENTESSGMKVSKEVFYNVTDDLTNSLKRRGDGFSLLSMFGRGEENEDNNSKQTDYNEKILINKGDLMTSSNPFTFDSSESENEENDRHQHSALNHTKQKNSKSGKTTKTSVWTENFFFVKGDPRFKEGVSFFKAINKPEDDEKTENYDNVKEKLRVIINKKIFKTKKKLQLTNNRNKSKRHRKVK